jgi:hypothetical protein
MHASSIGRASKILEENTMDEIYARTIALTSSPAGCAFLLWAERVGMSPADAADPLMSFFLTGRALNDVTVWRSDQADEMQKLLREGPRLRSFASAVLSHPDAAWWFAPLDRAFQLLSKNPGTAVVPVSPAVPVRPPPSKNAMRNIQSGDFIRQPKSTGSVRI